MQLFKNKPKVHPSGKPIAKHCFTCDHFKMNTTEPNEGNRGCKAPYTFVRQMPTSNPEGKQYLIWIEGSPCPAWTLAEDWRKRDLGLFGAVR